MEYFVLYKAHSSMHCAMKCKELNPRVGWCFSAESFMGVCRRLALKSNASNRQIPHCNLLTAKYSVGIHLAMGDPNMFFFAFDR